MQGSAARRLEALCRKMAENVRPPRSVLSWGEEAIWERSLPRRLEEIQGFVTRAGKEAGRLGLPVPPITIRRDGEEVTLELSRILTGEVEMIHLSRVPLSDVAVWTAAVLTDWADGIAEGLLPEPVADAMPEEETITTGAPDAPANEERALAVLVAHPEWTNTRIAEEVGCSRRTLYRWSRFVAARKVQRQGRDSLPRGRKSAGGDLEAWD